MVSAQAPDVEYPALPPEWLTKPANDSAVLGPEPFDGALRAVPAAPRRRRGNLRVSGLFTTAASGLAIAAAAAVLTIGWFNLMDPRSSADVPVPSVGQPPGLQMTQQGPVPTEGPTPALAEGLDALRSQMQAAQAANPPPAVRVDAATAEKPDVDGQSAASAGAAIAPTPSAAAPAIEAAASQTKMTGDEIRAMLARAKGLIAVGDIAAARRLAEYVAAGGDGGALFLLAMTFDPKQLARWRVRGVRADIERARDLYRQALQRGVAEAQNHLAALP